MSANEQTALHSIEVPDKGDYDGTWAGFWREFAIQLDGKLLVRDTNANFTGGNVPTTDNDGNNLTNALGLSTDTGDERLYQCNGVDWVEIADLSAIGSGGSSYSLPTDIEDGGSAEMSVEGLSGDLADPQDPKSHTHTLSNLSQSSASPDDIIQWNGSSWVPVDIDGATTAGPLEADVLVFNNSGTITAVDRTGTTLDSGTASTPADARTVIQSAIDATPDGGELYVSGNYSLDANPLTLENIEIRGTATLTQPNADIDVFQTYGTIDDANAQPLTADAGEGDSVITVQSASLWSEGDLVAIQDDTAWSPSNPEPTGEVERVESVDTGTNQLYLNGPLIEDYTTAQNATATQIEPVTATYRDISIVGAAGNELQHGIDIRNAVDATVDNVSIERTDNCGVKFAEAYNCSVSDSYIYHSQRQTAGGSTGYGVWWSGGATNCQARDTTIIACRHAVAGTGASGYQPKNVLCTNLTARQGEQGNAATNHLYDMHDHVHSVVFDGCSGEVTDDFDRIFGIGARRCVIRDCTGRGKGYTGNSNTHFYGPRGYTDDKEVRLIDNDIENIRGFRLLDKSGVGSVRHFEVRGNTAVDGEYLVDLSLDNPLDDGAVIIADNTVRNPDDTVFEIGGSNYAVNGATIANNVVIGGGGNPAVFENCSDLVVTGNTFVNIDVAAIVLQDDGAGNGVTNSRFEGNTLEAGTGTGTLIINESLGSGNEFRNNGGEISLDGSVRDVALELVTSGSTDLSASTSEDTGIATDGDHYTVAYSSSGGDVSWSLDDSGANYVIQWVEESTANTPTVDWQLLRTSLSL